MLDGAFRRAGIHSHAHLFPERADRLQGTMDMRPGLDVHRDTVRARFGESLQIRIARRNHQVHIERLSGVTADRLDDVGPYGNVWNKMTVHDIDMDPVGAGSINGL